MMPWTLVVAVKQMRKSSSKQEIIENKQMKAVSLLNQGCTNILIQQPMPSEETWFPCPCLTSSLSCLCTCPAGPHRQHVVSHHQTCSASLILAFPPAPDRTCETVTALRACQVSTDPWESSVLNILVNANELMGCLAKILFYSKHYTQFKTEQYGGFRHWCWSGLQGSQDSSGSCTTHCLSVQSAHGVSFVACP